MTPVKHINIIKYPHLEINIRIDSRLGPRYPPATIMSACPVKIFSAPKRIIEGREKDVMKSKCVFVCVRVCEKVTGEDLRMVWLSVCVNVCVSGCMSE